MSRQALYRKYRSSSLDEIIGQDHIVEVLSAGLKAGKTAQVYLLTGPRGVGKTSVARILAYELNGLSYGGTELDIIEIDAASNGSVDDARELRDRASIAPSSLKYKVYIIDEVHMLSRQAFDALLKLTEEPPEHAIFIMATTEVDKVPATIKSRAEQYHFHLVPTDVIAAHLTGIAESEKMSFEPAAIELLAELGRGSLRDAISLLDQMSSGEVTLGAVERTFGLPPSQQLEAILTAMGVGDAGTVVSILNELRDNGMRAGGFVGALIRKLEKEAATEPRYFDLIDRLLDVAKAGDPDLKLMAVLGTWSAPVRPETPEKSAPKSEITAPSPAPKTEKKVVKKPETTAKSDDEKPQSSKKPEPPQKSDYKIVWTDVVREIRSDGNPVFASQLARAKYTLDGDGLTLQFSSKIARDTAADAKHKKIIADAVKKLYDFKPVIDVSSDVIQAAKPTSASEYSTISAIMGGGERV
ncbi:MAG: DNA polymerase III subunit gamma/tau [Candidatus Nomurabacteria bacterium]|jgi:DNA polymerase-3 subunit gamma/tau|nr:DNA polymerase III subunit gamma/tau [Candidatus Nomurabacteria bacterium]